MRIDIITACPELLESPLNHSIIARAKSKGLCEIYVHNLRDWTLDKHRKVDDYPFGGGAGMVMMVQPIADCIAALKAERNYDAVLFMAPDGQTFNQAKANQISMYENVIILCGHYKGVDERVRELFVTEEISIGDYVLSGGEIAAMAIVDAVARVIPGVIGDESSALTDSFQDGLLSPPVYTRPADYEGHCVPEILLSGNQRLIDDWKLEQQLARTKARRPDLLDTAGVQE